MLPYFLQLIKHAASTTAEASIFPADTAPTRRGVAETSMARKWVARGGLARKQAAATTTSTSSSSASTGDDFNFLWFFW